MKCVSIRCPWRRVSLGGHILVGANTGSLEGLGGDLLILVGDEVDAERELVNVGALAAKVEDANLGVRHTTVEARLRVRLLSRQSVCVFFLVLPPLAAHLDSFSCTPDFRSVSSVGGGRQNWPYLVLAVAVASRGTTGHFDGISVVDGRGRGEVSRMGDVLLQRHSASRVLAGRLRNAVWEAASPSRSWKVGRARAQSSRKPDFGAQAFIIWWQLCL